MSAKKNNIRDLRHTITAHTDTIAVLERKIQAQAIQIKKLQTSRTDDMFWIKRTASRLAETLQTKFNKELTWLELSDDPASSMQTIKRTIRELKSIVPAIQL